MQILSLEIANTFYQILAMFIYASLEKITVIQNGLFLIILSTMYKSTHHIIPPCESIFVDFSLLIAHELYKTLLNFLKCWDEFYLLFEIGNILEKNNKELN